jgi:hypothetical protein
MKHLGGLLFLAIVLASALAPVHPATAQTVTTHNNQLKVTGIVLPAHHVIVNDHGNIIEILSNTDKDVLPKVYANTIKSENARELTSDIYEQYRRLVPEGQSRMGTLYKYTPGAYTFVPLETSLEPRITSPALPSQLFE